MGWEEEKTRSNTCFRFLKPIHLLPVPPTPASASRLPPGGGGEGDGVAAGRRSWPPARPLLPLPLLLTTPSCKFFQSRAWKEEDAAGSGEPALAARGSILHPLLLLFSPPPPPPSLAAPPPGAPRWRRRRGAQQQKQGVPSGFRPALGTDAPVAVLQRRDSGAASSSRTCRGGLALALNPCSRACKVSSFDLHGSSPRESPRPRPTSLSLLVPGSEATFTRAYASSCTGDSTRRPAGSTCQRLGRLPLNWTHSRLTQLGRSS